MQRTGRKLERSGTIKERERIDGERQEGKAKIKQRKEEKERKRI